MTQPSTSPLPLHQQADAPQKISLVDRDAIKEVLAKSASRWLNSLELDLLISASDAFGSTAAPPEQPQGGELWLYRRSQCKRFRKDGITWAARGDGRTVSEAHEACKLPSKPGVTLHIYYASSQDGSIHRRIFWRTAAPEAAHYLRGHDELGEDDAEGGGAAGSSAQRQKSVREDTVLVHYLWARDARAAAVERTSSSRRRRSDLGPQPTLVTADQLSYSHTSESLQDEGQAVRTWSAVLRPRRGRDSGMAVEQGAQPNGVDPNPNQSLGASQEGSVSKEQEMRDAWDVGGYLNVQSRAFGAIGLRVAIGQQGRPGSSAQQQPRSVPELWLAAERRALQQQPRPQARLSQSKYEAQGGLFGSLELLISDTGRSIQVREQGPLDRSQQPSPQMLRHHSSGLSLSSTAGAHAHPGLVTSPAPSSQHSVGQQAANAGSLMGSGTHNLNLNALMLPQPGPAGAEQLPSFMQPPPPQSQPLQRPHHASRDVPAVGTPHDARVESFGDPPPPAAAVLATHDMMRTAGMYGVQQQGGARASADASASNSAAALGRGLLGCSLTGRSLEAALVRMQGTQVQQYQQQYQQQVQDSQVMMGQLGQQQAGSSGHDPRRLGSRLESRLQHKLLAEAMVAPMDTTGVTEMHHQELLHTVTGHPAFHKPEGTAGAGLDWNMLPAAELPHSSMEAAAIAAMEASGRRGARPRMLHTALSAQFPGGHVHSAPVGGFERMGTEVQGGHARWTAPVATAAPDAQFDALSSRHQVLPVYNNSWAEAPHAQVDYSGTTGEVFTGALATAYHSSTGAQPGSGASVAPPAAGPFSTGGIQSVSTCPQLAFSLDTVPPLSVPELSEGYGAGTNRTSPSPFVLSDAALCGPYGWIQPPHPSGMELTQLNRSSATASSIREQARVAASRATAAVDAMPPMQHAHGLHGPFAPSDHGPRDMEM